MFSLIFFAFLSLGVYSKIVRPPVLDRTCLVDLKDCDMEESVCGIRKDGEGYRLRIFQHECDLIKFGCVVQKKYAYEKSPMHYCRMAFKPGSESNTCTEYDCRHPDDNVPVCASTNGQSYRVRLFENKCRLWEYNCIHQEHFIPTDLPDCDGLTVEPEKNSDTEKNDIINTNQIGDGYIYVNGIRLREDNETHIIMEDNVNDSSEEAPNKNTKGHYEDKPYDIVAA